jgi:type I restriction enzyme S subunit
MSEVPTGWGLANLGEVASFVMGQAPPGRASNFDGIGTPFVKAGEFGQLRPVIREWTTQPLKMATESDVLICVVGATSGKINLGANCAIGRSVAAIRPMVGINQFYLHSFMRTQVDTLRSGSTGTAQGVISSAMLSNVKVPIAPLLEQGRIVAKVDGLTGRTARARKELDRIPALVARYKQRILALAAEGTLTSKWRAENDASEWVPISVAEIAETTFDGPFGSNLKSADYVESGVRVVRLENIGTLRFIREKETYVSEAKFKTLARHELQPDDVLFSSFIAEEIRVCMLPDDLDTIAINKADCFCIRVDRQLCLPKFLAFRLASPTSYEALKKAVHGATRPRISLTHLKQFEIELPSLAEQAEIVRVLESAFGWLDRMAADHSAASKLLPKLDTAILGKAFRGELVPQDPNDEPASILLDRIKAESETASKGRRARSEGAVLETRIKVRDEVIRPRRTSKGQSVSKSRQDDDVFGKPYLAAIIKKGRGKNAQELFKSADLPVSDFYKQLAWETDQKHIRDHGERLEAA